MYIYIILYNHIISIHETDDLAERANKPWCNLLKGTATTTAWISQNIAGIRRATLHKSWFVLDLLSLSPISWGFICIYHDWRMFWHVFYDTAVYCCFKCWLPSSFTAPFCCRALHDRKTRASPAENEKTPIIHQGWRPPKQVFFLRFPRLHSLFLSACQQAANISGGFNVFQPIPRHSQSGPDHPKNRIE